MLLARFMVTLDLFYPQLHGPKITNVEEVQGKRFVGQDFQPAVVVHEGVLEEGRGIGQEASL